MTFPGGDIGFELFGLVDLFTMGAEIHKFAHME